MLAFRAVALCLVAGLTALPLAPVEHVHQTDGPDGHHQTVAHTHFADHHHRTLADDDHFATHVEDDDSVVVTFDRIFVPQPVHHIALSVGAVRDVPPPAVVRAGASARYLQQPIHGPPRAPTGLRAPPAFLS